MFFFSKQYDYLLEFYDYMLSREDGKHYKKHELDELNIFELIEHEYRIIKRQEEQERQKELQNLDNW